MLWRCWLGGRKGIQPVKNKWWGATVLVWLFVWSKVQTCIWTTWCHCHSLSLASVKSRLVLPFWYQLTWVVPEKGPLNRCLCMFGDISVNAKQRIRFDKKISGSLGHSYLTFDTESHNKKWYTETQMKWWSKDYVGVFICFLCRKTRYFIGDRLNWDEHSRDGKAVRQQCKPLLVVTFLWHFECTVFPLSWQFRTGCKSCSLVYSIVD